MFPFQWRQQLPLPVPENRLNERIICSSPPIRSPFSCLFLCARRLKLWKHTKRRKKRLPSATANLWPLPQYGIGKIWYFKARRIPRKTLWIVHSCPDLAFSRSLPTPTMRDCFSCVTDRCWQTRLPPPAPRRECQLLWQTSLETETAGKESYRTGIVTCAAVKLFSSEGRWGCVCVCASVRDQSTAVCQMMFNRVFASTS